MKRIWNKHKINTPLKPKVFVGLSGGVDSSVAAKRLIEEGYEVVGVFIKTWQPDFIACNWEQERLDAMRVAAHLNIKFLTCNAEDSYKRDVADYMISEYKKGKTPNPDVMCNRYVKFGTFLEFAKAHGAQKIATGHYAQIKQIGGQYELHRGADPDKDQSYFLWTLTQVQLQHIHFPIGDTRKKAVRKEAEEAEIPTFSKPDSQGICFLGPVDMPDFLSHYLHIANGSVLDAKGAVVGEHKGALLYTSGQRHGFLVHASGDRSAPLYVVGRDLEANTVTVSPEQPKSTRIPVSLSHLHFVNEPFSGECEAQFRYRQRPFKAVLEYVSEDHAHIEVLDSNVDAPSEGQSCVFYRGTRCLGGAIIDSQPERKNIDE